MDPVTEETLWMQALPGLNKGNMLIFDGYDEIFCIEFAEDKDAEIVGDSMKGYYDFISKKEQPQETVPVQPQEKVEDLSSTKKFKKGLVE